MKTKSHKLVRTTDYNLFEMHPCNRPLHENKILEASMRLHGFMPSSPIQCVRNGNGKLKILRGHHRFSVAKRLGLPLYYVIDESNIDIFNLEGASTVAWSVSDFAAARARNGDKNAQQLIGFKDKHGLTLGQAASLVGGESASSGNKVRDIKTGTFKIGDMSHAKDLVRITDKLRQLGINFATSASFVSALSKVLRVPEVNYATLEHRITTNAHLITRRATVRDYLAELEAVYNYSVKGKRLPLAFRADEVARQRSAVQRKQLAG